MGWGWGVGDAVCVSSRLGLGHCTSFFAAPLNSSYPGLLVNFDSNFSILSFRCPTGMVPQGGVHAVCGEDGEWRPDPDSHNCTTITAGKMTEPFFIPQCYSFLFSDSSDTVNYSSQHCHTRIITHIQHSCNDCGSFCDHLICHHYGGATLCAEIQGI